VPTDHSAVADQVPVMNEAFGDIGNATACATSSGAPSMSSGAAVFKAGAHLVDVQGHLKQ
jgi:hypothetical protein